MRYRMISSILVLITGVLLFGDKVCSTYNINFKNNFGFDNTANLVWFIGQIVSLVIFIFISAINAKPYKISYSVPFYASFIQLYWIFFATEYSDKSYFNIYGIGLTILFLTSIALVSKFVNQEIEEKKEKDSKIELLENIMDLTILRIKRKK